MDRSLRVKVKCDFCGAAVWSTDLKCPNCGGNFGVEELLLPRGTKPAIPEIKSDPGTMGTFRR